MIFTVFVIFMAYSQLISYMRRECQLDYMNFMRTRIKKAKPELSQCLMQSNTENNWKKKEMKLMPPFLHYMQLQKE